MTVTAPPLTRERSVEITLLRAKILSPTESPHLVTSISGIVGGFSILPGHGRYGYAHSSIIVDQTNVKLSTVFQNHKHPSATPCVEIYAPVMDAVLLKQLRESNPLEITAINVNHSISYLAPAKVVDLCCMAIGHEQGSENYRSIQEVSRGISTFTFDRDGSQVHVKFKGSLRSADCCVVSIAVNPESAFRPMITEQPILGAWACAYWTRALSRGLFGNRDPLDSQFDELFDEPLTLPPGGRSG